MVTANFDHDHPQNSKIFIVKMVNPNGKFDHENLYNSRFFVVEIFEIGRNC
jgi:hypothetical protein